MLAGNFDDFSFVAFDVNSFPCGVYKHVMHIINMDMILVNINGELFPWIIHVLQLILKSYSELIF